MKTDVADLSLYRWRYWLGYSFVALLIIFVIGWVAISVPGGLRPAEQQSALTSGAMSVHSLDPHMIINWPYHALQRGSFLIFGVTQLSIKLPSLIIGLLTAVGIFLLVRTWFRRNIAIIVTVIAVTMTPFLFMIQDGTPLIMFTALTIWLLVTGTFVTREHLFGTFWKVLGCVLLALSLYIPLGIYVSLALVITMLFHPHIRYVIKKITKLRLILALVLGVLFTVPLVYAFFLDHSVAAILLGIPQHGVDLGANLVAVGQNLFGFFSSSNSFILRPMLSLAVALLVLIGIYRLLTVKYTARSYTVLILGVIVSIIVIINPSYVFSLYPLAVLMVAVGMATLIVDWYKLFPRNPYARIAGLVPLSVLVIGLAFSGLTQFTNNYLYNPNILASYNYDLRLLETHLDAYPAQTVKLVASTDEAPFYALVARYNTHLSVATSYSKPSSTTLVTHDRYHTHHPHGWALQQIITGSKSSDSDRFYLYKTSDK